MDLIQANNFLNKRIFCSSHILPRKWKISKRKDLMKISKVIFHIKLIPSHPWWECKTYKKCHHFRVMDWCLIAFFETHTLAFRGCVLFTDSTQLAALFSRSHFYLTIFTVQRWNFYQNVQKTILKNSYACKKHYTEKNNSRNFTQLLSTVGTDGQVEDYLILL